MWLCLYVCLHASMNVWVSERACDFLRLGSCRSAMGSGALIRSPAAGFEFSPFCWRFCQSACVCSCVYIFFWEMIAWENVLSSFASYDRRWRHARRHVAKTSAQDISRKSYGLPLKSKSYLPFSVKFNQISLSVSKTRSVFFSICTVSFGVSE